MSRIEGQFAGGSIPVLEKTLGFLEARHRLLVQNVANASTPGYRPVDLDENAFQRLLKQAIERRRAPGGNLRAFEMPALPAQALREGQVRHDGNPFNPEREMARLADNAISHERAAQLLAGSYRTIELAIRGRV